MDTTAIAMRLRRLDSYLRTLRQMQAVPLDEYLSDDNIREKTIITGPMILAAAGALTCFQRLERRSSPIDHLP